MEYVECLTRHQRLAYKKHKFSVSFLWFCLDPLAKNFDQYCFISKNRFNLFSFFEKDYLSFNDRNDLQTNIAEFLIKQQETRKVDKLRLYTNLSFLGYLFNPVCIFKLWFKDGSNSYIIQITNTFGEQKSYYIKSEFCQDHSFKKKFKKFFYISPFIKSDLDLEFYFAQKEDRVHALVKSIDDDNTVHLQASLDGRCQQLSNKRVLFLFFKYFFNTQKIIFFIHFHALILWLKKVPFFKKSDQSEFQKGYIQWKK